MTEGKHTPGPWKYDGTFITGANGRDVANADGDTYEEARANAALIADAWQLPALRRVAEAARAAIDYLGVGEIANEKGMRIKAGQAVDVLEVALREYRVTNP